MLSLLNQLWQSMVVEKLLQEEKKAKAQELK